MRNHWWGWVKQITEGLKQLVPLFSEHSIHCCFSPALGSQPIWPTHLLCSAKNIQNMTAFSPVVGTQKPAVNPSVKATVLHRLHLMQQVIVKTLSLKIFSYRNLDRTIMGYDAL